MLLERLGPLMSFTSLKFVCFFAVAALGWYSLPQRVRKVWLLGCCYWFYMVAQPIFGLLLAAGTLVGYGCALACGGEWLGQKKLWTAVGVLYTFGLLFLYKYLDFFCTMLGMEQVCFSLALPVGISFFSFAVCGYLFDVQKGKLEAERSLLDFAIFVAFFPTLLAGPIGRAREFLPQLKQPPRADFVGIRRGWLRFLWGAAKKLVLADTLGIFVDAAYAAPRDFGGGTWVLVALCYALQIYYDFSAYSDMAIGSAGILGFGVTENFRAPYLSTSVKAFWKKWHISLTSWFREYLYFPLGGSRKGFLRTQWNVIVVFAVSGLWHGAAWTFLVWGLLNGLYQAAGAISAPLRKAFWSKLGMDECHILRRILGFAWTFGLLTFSWIFFRAENIGQAIYIVKRILLILRDGWSFQGLAEAFPLRQVLLAGAAVLPCVAEDIGIACSRRLTLEKTSFRYWLAVAALVLVIGLFGVYGEGFNPKDFLYFNF